MISSLLLKFALFATSTHSTECPKLHPGFDSPAAIHRPKFRYWLPDAGIDHQVLQDDISQIKNIGGGGLEFVPYYNYGFGTLDNSNWDLYAFGKPAFKDVLRTALETCKANDMIMDFALGASQGQGVPVEPLTPGLAVQLVYGKTTVKGGELFQGELPEPIETWKETPGFMQPQERFGGNRLVGVSAAAVKNITYSDGGDVKVLLDEASLVDLSEEAVNGNLTWSVPSDHEQYIIFAHYEQYTNQRSCVGIPGDVISNGSWVTDHFSAAGPKLVTEFWERNLLDHEIRDLLKSVVQHSWEDSMEIQASLYWTPHFIDKFTDGRGYNPIKYLPLMFSPSNSFHGYSAPYNTTFYLQSSNNGDHSKYLEDYRTTLTEGYKEYLQALESWAQSLGISHSCQVAYNLPLDLPASVPLVSGPELESLGFTNVDQMLQFVGPAHLGGRNVISTEIGAVPSGGYSQTLPSLVNLFNDAFSAGVNMMVIHGMQHSGDQPNTTWPGYTPFQYRFTEVWGSRQPAWTYMGEVLNYTARNQAVLQTGTAKRDLAFYFWKDPWAISTIQDGAQLRQSGFTYEYLSPSNLNMETVRFSNGVLAPSGPGYRALIFDHQKLITPEASDVLLKLAKEGLPIVFIGSVPNSTVGSSGQSVISERMASLKSADQSNVKFIQHYDDLLGTIDEMEVKPRVSVESSAPSEAAKNLYTVWRSDHAIDYIFLHNKGPSATYNISIETDENKTPYKLNAWTGAQETISVYGRSPNGITVQVTLQPNQTTIIALSTEKSHGHVISHSDNIVQVSYNSAADVSVLVNDSHTAWLALSNGQIRNIPAVTGDTTAMSNEFEIDRWNLTIESWIPSSNISRSQSVKEMLHFGPQSTLVPWSKIPLAQNVSGVGVYTANFAFPDWCRTPEDQITFIIHFGPVLNTLRVWINGQRLPAADIFDAQLDISDYIKPGNNFIRVETSSTLFNAVKARSDIVKTYNIGPLDPELYNSASWQPHGLIGPVRVTVLRKISLDRLRD